MIYFKRLFQVVIYSILGCLIIGAQAPTLPSDIPAQVLQAIQSGKTSFTLPDGNVILSSPIVIPAGTRNFTLQGGVNTTLITPVVLNKQAIIVGNIVVLSDNWYITGKGNIPIDPAVTGQNTITTATTIPLGYGVICDDYRVLCAKGDNSVMNHAEIVRITAFDTTTNIATLDRPAGREYGPAGHVWFLPCDSAICRNITVKNINFDGATTDGSGKYSQGEIMVGMADNVTLSNLNAKNFISDAISATNTRNLVIGQCSANGALSGALGTGYGITIYRCRNVKIVGCSSSGVQQSFMLHAGTMDVVIQSCVAPNDFDMHGFDERRIIIERCTGDGLDVGNAAWLGGESTVELISCNLTGDINFIGGNNIECIGCKFGTVNIFSTKAGTTPTVGDPASQIVDNLTFINCTMSNGGSCLTDEGADNGYGAIAFNNCTFTSKSTVVELTFDNATGNLSFNNCTFATTSTDHVLQFEALPSGGSLLINNCTLIGKGSLGIWIRGDCLASMTMTNSKFVGGSTFLWDDSGKVKASGNSVSQAISSQYEPVFAVHSGKK